MNVNGFTLKAVKAFKGREGEPCFQGNIYLENKKVGWFSSSYTMGPMDIRFDEPEIEKRFVETAVAFDKAYPLGFLYYNAPFKLDPKYNDIVTEVEAEDLVLEMLAIQAAEKDYKFATKGGNPVVIYFYKDGTTQACQMNPKFSKQQVESYFKFQCNAEIVLYADSLKVFEIEV